MCTIRAISLLILSALPIDALAQSFWLHNDISGDRTGGISAQVYAIDSLKYYWVHGVPDFIGLSSDYGSTWSYAIVDTPKYPLRKYGFTCFAAVSKDLILMGCNDRNVGHVIRSINFGKTWQDTSIGSYTKGQPGNFIIGMAALDSLHVAMLVGDTLTYISNRLLLSSDAGSTWTSFPTPDFPYAGPGSGLPPNPIFSYLNDTTLLVAHKIFFTNNSVISRTTNLGRTWHDVYSANSTITKFAFTSQETGFASGVYFDLEAKSETATIDKTTDGGATWHTILSKSIIPISTSYFKNAAGLYSIAFTDSIHGLACGTEGLILKTSDGGVQWEEMRSDYTMDASSNDGLTGIAYPDVNHAMITTSSGSVLIYHPEGLLDLPNITYPQFTPFLVPKTFDVLWDPVPEATWYSVKLTTSGYPDSTTTVIFADSVVYTNSIRLTSLIDTSPPPSAHARQYDIYVQAFNATNKSNVAHRIFAVHHDSTAAIVEERQSSATILLYPNPATDWLNVESLDRGFSITDAIGRTWECPERDGRIDVSKLPSGVYYLHAGSRGLARFVKQ